MKLYKFICHKLIARVVLLAVSAVCFGNAAYATPVAANTKTTGNTCTVSVSPLTPHISPGGGETFQLQITMSGGAGCGWTTSSPAKWLHTHPASGGTNKTINVDVDTNYDLLRVAMLSVIATYNSQYDTDQDSIHITQPTVDCPNSFTFDTASVSYGSGNEPGHTKVSTPYSLCPRGAVSDSNWIKIGIGNDLLGSGTIFFDLTANNGPMRTGKIKLGKASLTVIQASGCSYSFGTTSKNFDAAGGAGSINVTALNSACPRNATSTANWLVIVGGNNSVGSGPLTYNVGANPGGARTGQIKLGDQTFTVTQAAGACNFTLSPSIFNFQAGNGLGTIQVTASSSSCAWGLNSSASWVKITSKPVGGTGTLYFSVEPNPGAKRTATITVGNKVATINQAANSNCTFTINPGSAQVGVSGGSVNVGVSASNFCAWTTASSSPFISVVSGAVGAGSGPVKLKVLPNPGAPRSGSVTIAGKSFLVNQIGVNGAAAMWITDLYPGFAAKGGKEFQMTVKGANFANGCKVRWNGEDRQTSFVNSSTLVVTIPADDITDEGVNDVTVAKPNSADETNAEQFTVYGAVANVSSASFKGEALAPASLVSAFGIDLATELKIADSQPLPTELAGTTVTITDASGKDHFAELFFVSPGQINYLMPEGLALGKATVMIESGDGHTSVGVVEITQVSPALFTVNSSGQGIVTAVALRVKANGQQVYEQVAQYDSAAGLFKAKPIDLSVPGEQVYLIFYGTGFRYRNSINSVSLEMGGALGNVLYAGQAPGFLGLDQINVLVPNSLSGRGEVDVLLTVDGRKANTVKLIFK